MNIRFEGRYKSLSSFQWNEIPKMAIVTGPNGTGKSQLLDLINKKYEGKLHVDNKVIVEGLDVRRDEVMYIQGDWNLANTGPVGLASIQTALNQNYNKFITGNLKPDEDPSLYYAFEDILKQSGKPRRNQITFEEFVQLYPEFLFDRQQSLPSKVSQLFYEYRLDEIDLLSRGLTSDKVMNELGPQPWQVVRDILKAAKLPFEINDPQGKGTREQFTLTIFDEATKANINFNDLSSGEKVLFSLVFFLFSSEHKKKFPKLLLLDEPDAHLHPSMSQQLLGVLKNVLIDKYGVQLMMTSHSPSTIVLAPEESIFEMSKAEPRIRKSISKNHSVSLLTSGIVFVGPGTKYLLVEDEIDAEFYSHVNNLLLTEGTLDGTIPLVFIPASTKHKPGGKNEVINWVEKMQSTGISSIINGIIDRDDSNQPSDGIFVLDRYSIENYLVDPLVTYAALMDMEKPVHVPGITLGFGEEFKLKLLSNESLQSICDALFTVVEPVLSNHFSDKELITMKTRRQIDFTNGTQISYPDWIWQLRGKTLLNKVYQEIFTSTINTTSLMKAFRKINFIPVELQTKFEEMKAAASS